jgi:hypothetical protein
VSSSLQAVGIGEVPIMDSGEHGNGADSAEAPAGEAEHSRDPQQVVNSVTELATRSAERRGASAVGTVDVLVGAMDFYGDDFDRILKAYGTDRREVLDRALAAATSAVHEHEPLPDDEP